jgi:hypothetical protein
VTIATSSNGIYKVDLNDRGEVVWGQQDESGYSHIYSSLRGQLTSGPAYHYNPSINNRGDVVFVQPGSFGYPVYLLAAGSSTPVAVTDDLLDRRSPAINDSGEIVWAERDMYNSTGARIVSSTRGELVPAAADIFSVDLNNCGDIAYITYESGENRLYRLNGSATCTDAPAREFTLKLHLLTDGTGGGSVSSTLAGIKLQLPDRDGYAFFAADTPVALRATPAADSVFVGWSGACTGTGTCTVTMAGMRDVSALFVHKATALTLTPSVTGSVKTAGTIIGFIAEASGGSGNYEYQYKLKDPAGVTTEVKPYQTPGNAWEWNTGGLAPGSYTVYAYARNVGSTVPYETVKGIGYIISSLPVTAVTLTSNAPKSTVTAGTAVLFTAQASGGTEPYEYQFKLKDPAGVTTEVKPYITRGNTWEWTTGGIAPGVYTVYVYARSAGSKAAYEAVKGASYIIVPPPATAVALTSNAPKTTVIAGTAVLFTAQASGGAEPYEYQLKLKDPAGVTTEVKPYLTPGNTWEWTTGGSAPGVYTVYVYARSAGSKAAYEAVKGGYYTIVPPPVTAVTLASGAPVGGVTAGTAVLFTAQASGGVEPYEYQFKLKSGTTITEVKPYLTPGNTWGWDTAGVSAGTYTIYVYARSAGSKAAYEAAKVIYCVIK